MKIGIYLPEDFTPQVGGGFSYMQRLIYAIDNHDSFDKEIEIVFVTKGKIANRNLKHPLLTLPGFPAPSFTDKVRNKLSQWPILSNLVNPVKYDYPKFYSDFLKLNGVKFIYYPVSDINITHDLPFVTTYWDVGHLSTYPFPEMIEGIEHYRREYWYKQRLNQALVIFSESETGKTELVKYLNINPDKIVVAPIFGGTVSSLDTTTINDREVLSKLQVQPNRFFIYPAQFWAHKNHYHLVKAFSLFTTTQPDFKLILTGFDKGNINYIKQTIAELQLTNNVIMPGFVDDASLNALYRNATALTMTTFLGPTNMPLIEAFSLNCPVITTNLAGHKEMLGDAAIYINPLAPEQIAEAMHIVIDPAKRQQLLLTMQQHKQSFSFTIENTINAIGNGLKLATSIRATWG